MLFVVRHSMMRSMSKYRLFAEEPFLPSLSRSRGWSIAWRSSHLLCRDACHCRHHCLCGCSCHWLHLWLPFFSQVPGGWVCSHLLRNSLPGLKTQQVSCHSIHVLLATSKLKYYIYDYCDYSVDAHKFWHFLASILWKSCLTNDDTVRASGGTTWYLPRTQTCTRPTTSTSTTWWPTITQKTLMASPTPTPPRTASCSSLPSVPTSEPPGRVEPVVGPNRLYFISLARVYDHCCLFIAWLWGCPGRYVCALRHRGFLPHNTVFLFIIRCGWYGSLKLISLYVMTVDDQCMLVTHL